MGVASPNKLYISDPDSSPSGYEEILKGTPLQDATDPDFTADTAIWLLITQQAIEGKKVPLTGFAHLTIVNKANAQAAIDAQKDPFSAKFIKRTLSRSGRATYILRRRRDARPGVASRATGPNASWPPPAIIAAFRRWILLIAAAAEVAGVPLLHYDRDYERIARRHRQGALLVRARRISSPMTVLDLGGGSGLLSAVRASTHYRRILAVKGRAIQRSGSQSRVETPLGSAVALEIRPADVGNAASSMPGRADDGRLAPV